MALYTVYTVLLAFFCVGATAQLGSIFDVIKDTMSEIGSKIQIPGIELRQIATGLSTDLGLRGFLKSEGMQAVEEDRAARRQASGRNCVRMEESQPSSHALGEASLTGQKLAPPTNGLKTIVPKYCKPWNLKL